MKHTYVAVACLLAWSLLEARCLAGTEIRVVKRDTRQPIPRVSIRIVEGPAGNRTLLDKGETKHDGTFSSKLDLDRRRGRVFIQVDKEGLEPRAVRYKKTNRSGPFQIEMWREPMWTEGRPRVLSDPCQIAYELRCVWNPCSCSWRPVLVPVLSYRRRLVSGAPTVVHRRETAAIPSRSPARVQWKPVSTDETANLKATLRWRPVGDAITHKVTESDSSRLVR